MGQDNPQRVVQTFIDLVQRHEQAFYSFVHKVHSKGEGLFDNLMRWIELFLTAMRDGLGQTVSLEFLLPHAGPERAAVLKEVDEVAVYHYKLKLAYEDKLRRRFGKTQGREGADAEDEAAQALVNGVVQDLSFGELVRGDADDMAAEDSAEDSDEDSDDDSSEYETASESGSEETSSEEAGPRPGSSQTARTSTESHVSRQQPHPHKPHRERQDKDRPTRQASVQNDQTLRTAHSVSTLKSKLTFKKSDAPPVPALHGETQTPVPSKALPRSPLSPRPSGEQASAPLRPQPVHRESPKLRKRQGTAVKPPDLEHIPNLLPVFVEMVNLNRICTIHRKLTSSIYSYDRCYAQHKLSEPPALDYTTYPTLELNATA